MLLLAAGCTTGGPTLDEAAGVLAKDAGTLESLLLKGMKPSREGGRGDQNAPPCPEGTRRQTYHTVQDFPAGGQTTPTAWVDSMNSSIYRALTSLGYEKNDGANRERQDGVAMTLSRKDPVITFTIQLHTSQPNIEVTGITECLTGTG